MVQYYNFHESLKFCFFEVNLSESGELRNIEKYLIYLIYLFRGKSRDMGKYNTQLVKCLSFTNEELSLVCMAHILKCGHSDKCF